MGRRGVDCWLGVVAFVCFMGWCIVLCFCFGFGLVLWVAVCVFVLVDWAGWFG